MGILVSGLIGALLATLFSVLYNHISEQVKWRIDLTMANVEWLDNIYARLRSIQIHKDGVYKGEKPFLSDEEFRKHSYEVSILLLSEKIKIQVALIYGEGEKLQKINTLQGELTKIAQMLWAADKNTWDQVNKKIMETFSKTIDPLRGNVSKDFLLSAKKITMFKNVLKTIFSTPHNLCLKVSRKNGTRTTFPQNYEK